LDDRERQLVAKLVELHRIDIFHVDHVGLTLGPCLRERKEKQ
jgi:hypothetical protein